FSPRLFHDNPQRCQIPRLGHPVHRGLNRAFRHQYVLPESPNRTAVARRIPHPPHRRSRLYALRRSRARCENHRLRHGFPFRNVQPLGAAKSPFAAVCPPPRPLRQRGRAHHPRHDFSVLLNPHQSPKRRNPPRKLFRPINRVDNHSRPPAPRRPLRYLLTGLLPYQVHRQPALRHLPQRHRLHALVRQRHHAPIALLLCAQLLRPEVPHRNRVRLLRDPLQQSPVFRPVTHPAPQPPQQASELFHFSTLLFIHSSTSEFLNRKPTLNCRLLTTDY